MSGLRCPHHAARLGRRLHSATAAPAPPRCIRRRRRSAPQPFDKILRQIAHSSLRSSHTICRKISLSVSPSSAHCARRRVSEANRAAGPALRPEIVRRRRRSWTFPTVCSPRPAAGAVFCLSLCRRHKSFVFVTGNIENVSKILRISWGSCVLPPTAPVWYSYGMRGVGPFRPDRPAAPHPFHEEGEKIHEGKDQNFRLCRRDQRGF